MSINTEIKPICLCHGKEMVWHRDISRRNDGRWRCKIKRQAYYTKDNQSIKAYIRKRKWQLIRVKDNVLKQLKEIDSVK